MSEDQIKCNLCGFMLNPEMQQRYFELETMYSDRIQHNMTPQDVSDIFSVYNEALKLFSYQHFLVYKLQCLLISALGDDMRSLRILLIQRNITYLTAVKFPTYTLAWALEEMGDLLSKDKSEEALHYFRRSFAVMKAITGEESAYTERIRAKAIPELSELF